MKPLGEAAAKALKHHQWHWCRRPNGFCEKPKWRLVAERLNMPSYQVIAFVNWLEELANAADQRGQVDHFSAAECATALGMPEEDAARIFAALEDPAIGWIAYDHVSDFHDRNRDWEDDTATARKRRQRARDDIHKRLAGLARFGGIEPTRRTAIETRLLLMDLPELSAIQVELRRAELSTGHGGHSVTPRDAVTVTPEQITHFTPSPVDNSGDTARGAAKGPSEEEAAGSENDPQTAARRWIEIEGRRIVVERMDVVLTRADVLIERWLNQHCAGDAVAFAEILREANRIDHVGARFHNDVVDACGRHQRQAQARGCGQAQLPLGRVEVVGKRGGGAA